MPSEALKGYAKKQGISLKTIERYWREAKISAKEQGREEDWQYIMGIVKRRIKNKKKGKKLREELTRLQELAGLTEARGSDNRFRASIYIDIFIPDEEEEIETEDEEGNIEVEYNPLPWDKEKLRAKAREVAEEAVRVIEASKAVPEIGNAYVGGVAYHPSGTLLPDKSEFDRL